jgi:hypothetical protein
MMNLSQPYDEQQQQQNQSSVANTSDNGNMNGKISIFNKLPKQNGETEPEPFIPVKDGLYRARLVNTKHVESKRSGRPMIQFTWELQGQPYGGKKLNSWVVTDSEKAFYVILLIAQCLLGDEYVEAEVDIDDLSDLHRRECNIQVEKIESNGKHINNVRRYYPIA